MGLQRTTVSVPTSDELVECLLAETGQREAGQTEAQPLLEFLKLRALEIDFAATLPEAQTSRGEPVRALLDFQERLVAVDVQLNPKRSRFSTFHEIGHYVLPDHVGQIVVCGDGDFAYRTASAEEREANAFAAELQFKGRLFRQETATLPISAATVKETATTFGASFEATARHLVEGSLRPCLLAVYAKSGMRQDGSAHTTVRYSVASPSFEQRFGGSLTDNDSDAVAAVWTQGRDIADSVSTDTDVEIAGKETARFGAEYFFNGYNAFCLLVPRDPSRP
jgi:hypothetical protein